MHETFVEWNEGTGFKYVATLFGFPNALAPLKYHVETGKPFEGKARDLPLAPAFC